MNQGEMAPQTKTLDAKAVEIEKTRLLAEFDFDLQRQIIRSHAERAGIQEPYLAKKEDILDYEGDALAHYIRKKDKQVLLVNFKKLIEVIPDPEKRKLGFWHIINHEQIHAASSDERGTLGYSSSGFPLYELWNEGVTELVARTVTKEYFTANGYSTAKVPGGYQTQVEFVELIAQKIGEVNGINQKVALEAIIHGMFTREDIYKQGLNELLGGIIPEEFFDAKLPTISSEEMQKIINNFRPKELAPSLDQNPSTLRNFWGVLRKLIQKQK